MACKGMKHFYKRTDPPFTLERAFQLTRRDGNCLIFTGPVFNHGYGRVPPNFTGECLAHRFVYTAINGQIENGLEVCHKCDTPLCINPDHLFIGTHAENMQDMTKKGRNWHSGRNGELNSFYGKKHTPETKAKFSELASKRRGINNPRNKWLKDILVVWGPI